jgi:cell surface protein SprA
MDLRNPDNVKSVVEYDVKTGNYVLTTRVGEMEISTPYTLTPDEYQKYSLQNDMTKYWREKNSATVKSNEDKFLVRVAYSSKLRDRQNLFSVSKAILLIIRHLPNVHADRTSPTLTRKFS